MASLSSAVTSSAENVAVTTVNPATGLSSTIMIPSFGFLQQQINNLNNTVQQLAGLGDSAAVITLPDGTTKQIITAQVARDPAPITILPVPSIFNIKNNWFFENFLNPLLYVSLDVTGQIPTGSRQVYVKRVICNTPDTTSQNFFDQNLSGKNDINYSTLLNDLTTNSINFFVDEEVNDLPTQVMRYVGNFDVLLTTDTPVTVTSNNTTVTVTKRLYTLSSLQYTDVLTGTLNSLALKVNDVLLTTDGSQYQVTTVNQATNQVILLRISGSQPITTGTAVLQIQSPPYTSQQVQVNIGFNERQVIFMKPIDPNFDVASSTYSPGTAFYSNDLVISTSNGNMTLGDFYTSQVTDFGQILLGSAKEKAIPAVYGQVPDAPALNTTNFQVLQTNSEKKSAATQTQVQQNMTALVQLQSQIADTQNSINTNKQNLNNNAATLSQTQIQKIETDLQSQTNSLNSLQTQYATIVNNLATLAQSDPTITEPAEYAVTGFFPIPAPMSSSQTQDQNVIQFETQYRYISTDGTAPGVQTIEFTDVDGTQKKAAVSNWTSVKSDILPRTYNSTTGFYEWSAVDVTNPDTVNVNQVKIPIAAGQQVQMRVRSISEAGWPLNPVMSDWSNTVTVPFPTNLSVQDPSSTIMQNALQQQTQVNFQAQLDALGLDLHLLDSFTQAGKYYAHRSIDIASGFFDSSGNVIDLFNQITAMNNQILALQAALSAAKGQLAVFIVDVANGNVTNVTTGSTIKLFAGYYKDAITVGSGNSVTYNHGQIVQQAYIIRIENATSTPLELAAYLTGGQTELPPSSITVANVPQVSQDYVKNRKYDLVPASLTSTVNASAGAASVQSPFQSAQTDGLWMYCRERNVGLTGDLYASPLPFYGLTNPNTTTYGIYNNLPSSPTVGQPSAAYNYQGVTIGASLVPVDGYHYFPYDPTFPVPGTTSNPNVWNGTVSGSGPFTANGGGFLSEFCIHINHPDLVTTDTVSTYNSNAWSAAGAGPNGQGTYQANQQWQPDNNGSWTMASMPKFLQALYFNEDTTNPFGGFQLQFVGPPANLLQNPLYNPSTAPGSFAATYVLPSGSTSSPTNTNNQNYPAKLGFTPNDYWLIGKYTCGVYLFIAPVNYKDIAVDGTTDLASYTLSFGEQNAVNVSLLFQMRLSDILGYVGGFNQSGSITNIVYDKKVGIDIQVQNKALFSFDVEVSAKYQKDSLTQPVYVPNVALDRLSAIRQANVPSNNAHL